MRNVTGAVLALLVGLGFVGCGSTHVVRQSRPVPTTTTTVAKAPPISSPPSGANLVVLPATHGAGNRNFGTFTPAGIVYLEYTCTGSGRLTIVGFNGPRPCNGSSVSVGISGYEGKPLNLTLRAKPGTTWWFAAGEHIPGAKLVQPTRVLVDRTGAGKASLGTFRLHGDLHVVTTCKGRGQLVVSVSSLARHHPQATTSDDYCPANHTVMTVPASYARSIRVDVTRAPRKGTWGVTLRETPAK